MGRFDGKVVLITGGARGQGLVEDLDRRCVGVTADVRDQVQAFADRARTELYRIDFLLANAGIFSFSTVAEHPTQDEAAAFRASMNPFDNVGTARISDSVYDRWCRLATGYQDASEESAIVAVRTRPTGGAGSTGSPDAELVADAVALTRATRAHADLRRGSSVRGAIDLAAIAAELERLGSYDGERPRRILDAAMLALSARIGVDEAADATPEEVITEIWENHFFSRPGGPRRDRTDSTSATR